MLRGSGGAQRSGHLRENGRAIVRSGDRVSNHKHENPHHQSATPKGVIYARARFRSASSYQTMEPMIAAAKGARINTFICGQSLTDPGAPNGEVASLQQIVGPKDTQAIARRIKLSYPAP
jgi:hypothetical protein